MCYIFPHQSRQVRVDLIKGCSAAETGSCSADEKDDPYDASAAFRCDQNKDFVAGVSRLLFFLSCHRVYDCIIMRISGTC